MDLRGRGERRVLVSSFRRGPHPLLAAAEMIVSDTSGRVSVNLGGTAGFSLVPNEIWDEAFFVA